MDAECLQNKVFGYLLDRFCVGWIYFGELHADTNAFIAIIVDILVNKEPRNNWTLSLITVRCSTDDRLKIFPRLFVINNNKRHSWRTNICIAYR